MTLWSVVLITLLYGPYQAKIVRVMDANTLKLNVAVWPGQVNQIILKVADIETPQTKGFCETERLMAREARAFTNSFLGRSVLLEDLQLSQKEGVYTATVKNDRGDDLARALMDAGYAVKFDEQKRSNWCPDRN
jgi:endonuclease YncB( thermonuclease family)